MSKLHPLTDQNAFIELIDTMGSDAAIVQAARTSYGKDTKTTEVTDKDRQLIRYLMRHSHTTPFEMVEFKFLVQVPMDCWRQWIRHRTASVNEYSTRYAEALDFFQVTDPSEWRLQAQDNKQGSSGYLEDWPDGTTFDPEPGLASPIIQYVANLPNEEELWGVNPNRSPGELLSTNERIYHNAARLLYEERLSLGIAKEQARKDLPLSTYTRAYWKCDLHNIFNFLRLRMDNHAQLEIRQFANAMATLVKEVVPVAYEAFEEYILYSHRFSRTEMERLRYILSQAVLSAHSVEDKPHSLSSREWKEFQECLKISRPDTTV